MESVGLRVTNDIEFPGAWSAERARKRLGGAANYSITKFPISGKVPLEWLMHRSASPSPGHAQSTMSLPILADPALATVLGGVSGPSNVRASDLITVSVAVVVCPRSLFPRSSTESFGRVGCGPVGVDAATCTQRALTLWLLGGPQSCPVSRCVSIDMIRLRRCIDARIVLSDAEYLVSVGSRPCSLVACAFCPRHERCSRLVMASPCLGSVLRTIAGDHAGLDVAKECYLVDPASSHMLVSKIKPCMFKKLVVGPRGGSAGPPHGEHRSARPYCRRCAPGLNWPGRSSGAVTLKKLECSKQAYACIH
ncbi:hypothetical protein V6N13_067947 [Hibiscus sabdariffa]